MRKYVAISDIKELNFYPLGQGHTLIGNNIYKTAVSCYQCQIPLPSSEGVMEYVYEFERVCSTCFETSIKMGHSVTASAVKCECGMEKHGFANHANWCDEGKYEETL